MKLVKQGSLISYKINMDIIEIAKNRYSTKEFDASKTITTKQLEEIQSLLQLCPSSTNLQPWHFIIANSEEAKKRVTKATIDLYPTNSPKILNSCVTIIFACKTQLDEVYLVKLLEQETKDGRFIDDESKQMAHISRTNFTNIHRYDYRDFHHWSEKQLFLNLGNFLLGVAALGLDAIAMEGIDLKILDQEFELRQRGLTSSFVVSVGYRALTDPNHDVPKSRFDKKEIIEIL